MTSSDLKQESLVAYVQADGRICPQPREWNQLWEMLPRKERVGAGWKPPLPLILGAWWQTSPEEKRARLREHIEYAAAEGLLPAVDAFLRGLAPPQWHTTEHE